MEEMDLNAVSIERLKSWAYDQLVILQQSQNNLNALNKAIEFKQKQEPSNDSDNSNNNCSQGNIESGSGDYDSQVVV